jgi:hypothetical protein
MATRAANPATIQLGAHQIAATTAGINIAAVMMRVDVPEVIASLLLSRAILNIPPWDILRAVPTQDIKRLSCTADLNPQGSNTVRGTRNFTSFE